MSDTGIKLEKEQSTRATIFYLLGCWVIYTVIYSALKHVNVNLAGTLSAIVPTLLIGVATYYAIWLWVHAKNKSKRIFGFFALSFSTGFLDNFTYQLTYTILHIPHDAAPAFVRSADNIFYIGYLIFLFLALGSALPKINFFTKKFANFVIYAPVVTIIAVVSTLFFLSFELDFHNFSLNKFYDLVEMVLQLSCFLVAIFCVVTTKNKGLFYMAISYVVSVLIDLAMNVNIFSQSFGTGSATETIWLLGVFFRVYGMFYFKHSGTYQEESQEWIYTNDNLTC